MLHAIRASAAIRTFLHSSMSESARNCCTALNPHKAIALPNPTRFSPNRRIHTAPDRQGGKRTSPQPEHCRYGAIDFALTDNLLLACNFRGGRDTPGAAQNARRQRLLVLRYERFPASQETWPPEVHGLLPKFLYI